jgi:hypothetical protein
LQTNKFAFEHLKYYPNPVNNHLSISNDAPIDAITVTSILGQTVFSKKINALQTEINMSELSSGIYFVKVASESWEKTIKILKE